MIAVVVKWLLCGGEGEVREKSAGKGSKGYLIYFTGRLRKVDV